MHKRSWLSKARGPIEAAYTLDGVSTCQVCQSLPGYFVIGHLQASLDRSQFIPTRVQGASRGGAAARHSGEDLKSEITMACCSSSLTLKHE